MTKRDRKQLIVLIALLAVLGVILYAGYGTDAPPPASPALRQQAAAAAPSPASNGARIYLDVLEQTSTTEPVGRYNLFQYRMRNPPPPAPVVTPPPQPVFTQQPVQQPSAPPAPPPMPFRYEGYAAVRAPSGSLIAFLKDDARRYNVTEGEVLMGRYRIVSVSEAVVEVEDTQLNRRQAFARMQQ